MGRDYRARRKPNPPKNYVMPKTEKPKISKKKKKRQKKRRSGFFKWLSMGVFSIFLTILLVGFIGTLAIYYTFTDQLPDVRKLKIF